MEGGDTRKFLSVVAEIALIEFESGLAVTVP